MEASMTSMKDVAKQAGVSISTVSRYINGSTYIEPETKRKIEKAIEETRFQPNYIAQGLRNKKTQLIGLVVPESLSASFTDFVRHIALIAEQNGYELIIRYVKDDPEVEKVVMLKLLRYQIDGIIFIRVSDKSEVEELAKKFDRPIVCMMRGNINEKIPSVVLNNYKVGEIVANLLVRFHHKKIVCITGNQNVAVSRERLDGFIDNLAKNNIVLPKENIYEGHFTYESGIDAIDYFISQNIEFTAVWGSNDLMAIGAMNRLQQYDLSVPKDVSVVGVDNSAIAHMLNPPLTTIAQPIEEMCKAAVELLISLIHPKEGTPLEDRIVFEPSIVLRGTLLPIKTNEEIMI